MPKGKNFFLNLNSHFRNNSTCEGVKIYVNCDENKENEGLRFLKRYKRRSDESSHSFGVRIDIPVQSEISMGNSGKNAAKKLDFVELIQNEALFKNLFNLEQVMINLFKKHRVVGILRLKLVWFKLKKTLYLVSVNLLVYI